MPFEVILFIFTRTLSLSLGRVIFLSLSFPLQLIHTGPAAPVFATRGVGNRASSRSATQRC
jgi:hypothetical protein